MQEPRCRLTIKRVQNPSADTTLAHRTFAHTEMWTSNPSNIYGDLHQMAMVGIDPDNTGAALDYSVDETSFNAYRDWTSSPLGFNLGWFPVASLKIYYKAYDSRSNVLVDYTWESPQFVDGTLIVDRIPAQWSQFYFEQVYIYGNSPLD